MRELLRSIAHAEMENRGITQINKKIKKENGKTESKFSRNWRRYAGAPKKRTRFYGLRKHRGRNAR